MLLERMKRTSAGTLVPQFLIVTGIRTWASTGTPQLSPPMKTEGREQPTPVQQPAEIVRRGFPSSLPTIGIALGAAILKVTHPAQALKVARFTNLALTSVMAGHGVASTLFIQPALSSLPKNQYFWSEQALAWRYSGVMRGLMPASVASCLAVLALIPDRTTTSFRLTAAGTVGFLGMLATTVPEVSINEETLMASPDSPPDDWVETRDEWNRLNQLRTVCEVAGWSFLCLAAIVDSAESRSDANWL